MIGGFQAGVMGAKLNINLLRYSQNFTVSPWTYLRSSVTISGSDAAPDGSLTANKVTQYLTGINGAIKQIFTFDTGSYGYSIYAKQGNVAYLHLYSTGTVYSAFNVATGVVISTGSGHTAAISESGNDWYRCSILTDTNNSDFLAYLSATVTPSITQQAGNYIYLWGAQLEKSTSISAYQSTN